MEIENGIVQLRSIGVFCNEGFWDGGFGNAAME